MTRKQLIKWSMARDALNFIVIGQLPGLNLLLDLPLWVMHFNYAGPTAIITLLEMIPVVGFFPVFTVAAMFYPDHDPVTDKTIVQIPSVPHIHSQSGQSSPPLYALVDGKLVPVIVPDAEDTDPQVVQPLRRLPHRPN